MKLLDWYIQKRGIKLALERDRVDSAFKRWDNVNGLHYRMVDTLRKQDTHLYHKMLDLEARSVRIRNVIYHIKRFFTIRH